MSKKSEQDKGFFLSISLSREVFVLILGLLLGGFSLFVSFSPSQKPIDSISPKSSLSFSHLGDDLEA